MISGDLRHRGCASFHLDPVSSTDRTQRSALAHRPCVLDRLRRAIPEPTLEARSRICDPPPRGSGEAPYRALAEPQYECLVACASISARLQFVVG